MSTVAQPAVAHGMEAPSAWVQRFAHLIQPGGSVLDVACGHGRHMRWLAGRGHRVTGIDRNPEALASVQALGETVLADIENHPWPLTGRQFDAVLVTNYLWRALWPQLLGSVRPGGVLIYETFAQGNERYGRPSRAEFLLRPGELLQVCQGMQVVAYEHGFVPSPDRCIQRIVARSGESLECSIL